MSPQQHRYDDDNKHVFSTAIISVYYRLFIWGNWPGATTLRGPRKRIGSVRFAQILKALGITKKKRPIRGPTAQLQLTITAIFHLLRMSRNIIPILFRLRKQLYKEMYALKLKPKLTAF